MTSIFGYHGRIWQFMMNFHHKIVRIFRPQFTRRCIYNDKDFSNSTITQIKFSESREEIEVSIIIPFNNQIQYTKNCLHSISQNTCGNYEVVVVDDASTDDTVSQLKNIANLTIIHNNENRGFVESCNRGAKSGKGKYLLFLNNDTLVTQNWLPPLLDLIKKDDVGAVGSKLIFPNGVLQEAGGIIWNNASASHYGRRDNPEKPEYNFVRDVDYCSGAALLVKKDIFERIGGFDTQFIPAYYEDTDLCFSIRKSGYRILYQPLSVVIHFEGVSNGTGLSTGIKKYLNINRIKFFKKWETRLSEHHYGVNSNNLFNARNKRNGKNILVIDRYVPANDTDPGSYRVYNFLKHLIELNHKVTCIGENLSGPEPYTTDLQQNGVEIMYGTFDFDSWIMNNGKYLDSIILSRPLVSIKYIDTIKANSKAQILYSIDDFH